MLVDPSTQLFTSIPIQSDSYVHIGVFFNLMMTIIVVIMITVKMIMIIMIVTIVMPITMR